MLDIQNIYKFILINHFIRNLDVEGRDISGTYATEENYRKEHLKFEYFLILKQSKKVVSLIYRLLFIFKTFFSYSLCFGLF